jgi:hypothetical protein
MTYFNASSPEYFVEWTTKRFFKIPPEDIVRSLDAIKSWIAVGNEHYSSYHPWIALRTYMFIVVYTHGVDIIEDCLDIELAKEIYQYGDYEIKNPCRQNLKHEFVNLASEWIMQKPRPKNEVENVLVKYFALYTLLLDQIKQFEVNNG